jgi:glycosyltransferase involved in cell wall biosynthesis
VKVLVATNFEPDEDTPQRGRWVTDQVEALRDMGVEVDLFSFPPGRDQYVSATRTIRRLLKEGDFDLVHAHYGLVGWCALAAGAKPLVVTFHGTDVRHPLVGRLSRLLSGRIALNAPVSSALLGPEGGREGLDRVPGRTAILPCGPSLERFSPTPQGSARERLGLERDARLLLFPADPARPEKRVELAASLADASGFELLTGGDIDPEEMPVWMNAADAVVVTSLYEGFGMACVEAISCETPVLSTPVGVAPLVLEGLPGALCETFEIGRWSAFLREVTGPSGIVVSGGAEAAAAFSARRMAERVMVAYREVLERSGAEVPISTDPSVSMGAAG